MNNVLFSISVDETRICRNKIRKFHRRHTFCGSKQSMQRSLYAFLTLSTQWYSHKCEGWVNHVNLCCIYAFTITIMFIVLCCLRLSHAVAKETCVDVFNVFMLRPCSSLVKCFTIVSLLLFLVEHGLLTRFVAPTK